MARWLPSERLLALQVRALSAGGTVRTLYDGAHSRLVDWDIAGDCERPVLVELNGRPDDTRLITRANPSRFIDIHVACRRCANCLRRRSALWRIRAFSEWRNSARTWLCTFTLRPSALVHLLSRARVRLGKAGTDYDALGPHDGFLELEKEGFRHVQLWLKRLRKAGHKVRYLAISERHKSGAPHWHILLHESDPLKPIRESELSGSWGLGFDSYRLVRNARGAGYVSKYLSKELCARVRASQGYGDFQIALTALGDGPIVCEQGEHSESGQERESTRERGNESEAYRVSEIAGALPRKEKLRF